MLTMMIITNSNYFLNYPRVFGRLVTIPFLTGRRSPEGLDAQQRAELKAEEVFNQASSAIGMLVGLCQTLPHILKTRIAELK